MTDRYSPKSGHRVKIEGYEEVFTLVRHYGGYGMDNEWHATHRGGESAGTVLIGKITYIPRHLVNEKHHSFKHSDPDSFYGDPDSPRNNWFFNSYTPRHRA